MFGGAYLRREICVSKSIRLALQFEVNLPFLLCFSLHFRKFFKYKPLGSLYLEGFIFGTLRYDTDVIQIMMQRVQYRTIHVTIHCRRTKPYSHKVRIRLFANLLETSSPPHVPPPSPCRASQENFAFLFVSIVNRLTRSKSQSYNCRLRN